MDPKRGDNIIVKSRASRFANYAFSNWYNKPEYEIIDKVENSKYYVLNKHQPSWYNNEKKYYYILDRDKFWTPDEFLIELPKLHTKEVARAIGSMEFRRDKTLEKLNSINSTLVDMKALGDKLNCYGGPLG